ncbi:MAG TPA: hypothetical protein VMB78_07990 [Dissulfurispiraceae bacterium]|nr:hypothetical protein [Dissulfurispiraceae bacterium]
MKKAERTVRGKGPIELIEEATHLLRIMPFKITALYYFGALPFILGLLYFVADMSKSAFAYQREAQAAFLMALLFLWMKCWQAVFCNRVKSFVLGTPAQKMSLPWIVRLCLKQAAIQPFGFIILPVAFVITLPFGYSLAFFQNASLLGDGKQGSLKELCRSALDQAKLFPGQNHVVLLIITLFSLFVLINVVLAMFMAPALAKTFFGIETEFTLAGWGLLNTTFFAAAVCIAHVLVDPLIKVIYVLRCFYGDSIRTGEDLKTELRSIRVAQNIAAALLILFLFVQPAYTETAGTPPPIEKATVSAAELERSLGEVITGKEYAWRLPREEMRQKQRGPFASFIEGVIDTLADWFGTLREWGVKIWQWLYEHLFRHFMPDPGPSEKARPGSAQVLLYILLAMVLCGLAVFALRYMKRRNSGDYLPGEPVMPAADISAEDVTADELPAEEWLLLSRQMAEKGDLRLALRALYLSGLAHLARNGILVVAKYKSNRDYERELKRKALRSPDLISAFSRNMFTFENVWYGMHDIPQDMFSHFTENYERIKTLADKL